MPGAILIDESSAPLYIVRFKGTVSDPDFDTYLRTLATITLRREQRALVYDATHADPTPASQRKKQAQWMKEYDTPTRLSTMGIAFVLPSAMMRGMLTAIFWLQPMSCPHHVTATLDDGVQWARGQLKQSGRSLRPGGSSTRP